VSPDTDPSEGAYRETGRVPLRGRVRESDEPKSGPEEVRDLSVLPSPLGSGVAVRRDWVDVDRPVLRVKTRTGGVDDANLEYRFQPVCDRGDGCCKLYHEPKSLMRERNTLERGRMTLTRRARRQGRLLPFTPTEKRF